MNMCYLQMNIYILYEEQLTIKIIRRNSQLQLELLWEDLCGCWEYWMNYKALLQLPIDTHKLLVDDHPFSLWNILMSLLLFDWLSWFLCKNMWCFPLKNGTCVFDRIKLSLKNFKLMLRTRIKKNKRE